MKSGGEKAVLVAPVGLREVLETERREPKPKQLRSFDKFDDLI
jgi:hypothetical protein